MDLYPTPVVDRAEYKVLLRVAADDILAGDFVGDVIFNFIDNAYLPPEPDIFDPAAWGKRWRRARRLLDRRYHNYFGLLIGKEVVKLLKEGDARRVAKIQASNEKRAAAKAAKAGAGGNRG